MTMLDIEKLIREQKAVLIGGRRFGQYTEESDYDICIMYEDLPKNLKEILNSGDFSISRYFNIIPPLGNTYLIRELLIPKKNTNQEAPNYNTHSLYSKVDFIVFKEKENLEVIKTVVDELSLLPFHYFELKQLRINIFEAGLLAHGFINKIKYQEEYEDDILF